MSLEYKVLGVVTINGALDAGVKVIKMIEPFLSPAAILVQIGVGLITIAWIYQRWKGQKRDNDKNK